MSGESLRKDFSTGNPDAAEVAQALGGKLNPKGYWMARCPCHDDRDPSLQIWDGDNGVAFKCYAGCLDAAIRSHLSATGILWRLEVARNYLRNNHVDSPDSMDNPVITRTYHVYTDAEGSPVSRVERVKYADGRKTFLQQRSANGGWLNGLGGLQPPLYNLPKVLKAVRGGRIIFVVEGEKHVDRLDTLDIIATTNPMGAGKWRPLHTEALKDAKVVILPDNDEPGRKHALEVAEALSGVTLEVKVLELPGLPPKGDIIDWLDGGGSRDELLRLADFCHHYGESEPEWEMPVPFDEPDLPTFPTEVLPSWLRSWVEEEAEATQTPVDLPAMIGLAAIASACQKKVKIRLWDGYEEPVNIYVAIVLPPGSRKSAVMADATRVIRKHEKEEGDKLRDTVAKEESRLRRLEKKLKFADQAAKGDGPDSEADRLAHEVAEARSALPVMPRLIADDVTPEMIVHLMAEQGGKISVFSPEGGIFETMAGRYSGSIPNFDAFLKAHTGEDIITDRLTRSGSHVPNAALTICLAIQPDVIRSLAGKNGFRGRGLTARFLYLLPKNLMGRRRVKVPPVSEFTLHDYEDNIKNLLSLPDGGGPIFLKLSDEALSAFEGFAEWLEPMLSPSGSLGFMADWGGKLTGAVARMAALLQMAQGADLPNEVWREPISADTINAAVKVSKYLIEHAKATYAEMGADKHLDDARYLWGWIEASGEKLLKKQTIWQGTRTRFRKATVLEAAIEMLCERGYLRERQPERRQGAGRKPAPSYVINLLAIGNCRVL